MSSIDKRVVQMVFDNDKFEKNIEQSRKSLEKMDKTLDEVANNTNVERLGTTIGDSLEQGVDKGIIKAEALRTVINTVIGSISSTVLGALHNIQSTINNLTFDQIGAGLDKYEKKLESVQTILSATAKSGETLESVEETMEKLMWYTDETSYNFSDMANNIGKFTAVGVELETASSAMQGIANWAGLAGQKAQAASRAMYNISQAMSAGYMKQQDWASIQNANMDTKEFRETAYKTAKELAEAGKYTELSLEWFDKNTYNEFFADLGKNKNFTTDVLIETLKKFSFYSDEIRRITEDENKTTIKAMDILGEISEDQVNELKKVYDEFGDGSEALQKEAMALGVSVETAANIAKAGWETFDLGRRAFEASQQYTTFSDVIDATTDAVSSLWMKIDQQIFGNLEEAKEFWTELGDIFYNIFATPVEKILEVFEAWNEFSGRKILLGIAEDGEKVVSVFEQIVKNLSSVVDRIKEAFFEVNPFFEDSEQMGAALAYATNKLREFLKTLQPTRQELLIVKDAFAFAFRILNGIFKVGYSIIKGAQIIVKAILPNMSELAKSLLPVFNELNERGDDINKLFIDISNSIYRVAYFIAKVITKFKESLMNGTIKDFLVDLGKFLIAYAIHIIDKIIHPVEEEMTGIPLLLYKVGTKVLEILGVIINVVANIVVPITTNLIIAVLEFLNSGIGQKIITFLDLLVRTVFSLFTLIVNVGITILEIINKIATEINKLFDNTAKQEKEFDKNTFIGGLSVALGVLMMVIGNFMEEYKKGNGNKVLEQLSDVFEKLGNAVDSFQRSINSVALKNIAKSVVMLAAAMMVIAFIPQDRLISSFAIVTIAVSGMLAVMLAISKSVGNGRSIKDILDFSKSLKALAGALTLISLNIRIMSKESLSTYGKGLLIVAGEMILVAQFVVMIMNATEPMKGVDVEAYKIQVQNIGKMFGIILALSVAMIAFSAAIKLIGSMNVDQLIIGLVGYFASIVGLIWVIREISKFFDNTAVLENFTKKIVALTGSIVMMVGAIIALMVPILIFGIVPQNIVMDGLIDVILELAVLLIAFDFVSKQTKSIDVKGLFALIALIGVLVISVNALLVAFAVFASTPTDQFDKAISGIKSLILVLGAAALALDFVFVILPKLLFKMEQTREFEIISDRQAHAWANDFVRLGAALIMMAVAVGILAKATTLLAETSKIFDINAAFWTVVKLLFAIDGFLVLQEILQRFIFKDPELGKTMLLYALQITAIAGAIAALAYAFDKFANTIDENKIDSALKKMGKSIVIVMGGILLVVAIVAILGKILQGRRTIGGFAGGGITKYLALPGPKSNKGEERVEKTTMSLTKEIVLFAAALMSFSLALSAMMLPIFVLSGDSISEDDFKKASKRLILLAAGLAGFIGALMLLYSLMGWITGGKAYGLSKKTTKNNVDLRGSIFGKNEFASRVSEMKGFGQNIAEMSKSLLMIVGSIFTLMLPLKILGGLNEDEFKQGLEGVVDMLLVVALSLSIMSLSMADFSTAKVFGIGIIMLAIFGVLTTILIKFQEVQEMVVRLKPLITVFTVISAVNAVLLIINKIRELIKKFKSSDDEEEEEDAIDKFKRIIEAIANNIIQIAAAFAIMSAGVAIIAFSLKEMSTVSLSWQQIAELASFVVGIGAFLAILGKMSTRNSAKKAEKETETTEVVIDETTSVLTVIGDTIGDASEETEEIAEDAESIADNMMKIAGAFDIMAAGLVIIVGAFKLMETVKLTPGQIALLSAYSAVIAGYLIAVSLLVKDSNTVLKAAGAFGIIAASIVALAAGLKVLSTIDEIGTKAIVALSVIITIVGAIVVLFGIFGNPAMGGTLLVAAGAIAAAFVSIALSILLVSFAAKVFAKAAKLYAEAVEYLIKVAENSEEGWAAIQKGLDVFIELASIILVVVVVLGALCALWHPLAVGALLGAAAILAIAVALVGVLGLLYLIALAWPTLKDNLDDLTEWLELHEEDWAKGIGKFLADVISSVETNLKQAGLAVDGTVGIMGGSITSLLDPINQVKSAFGSILDAPDAWIKAGINSDDNIFTAMEKMLVYTAAKSGVARADLQAAERYDEQEIDSKAKMIIANMQNAGLGFSYQGRWIKGRWNVPVYVNGTYLNKDEDMADAMNALYKVIREDLVPVANREGMTKEDFESIVVSVYEKIDPQLGYNINNNEQYRQNVIKDLENYFLESGGRLFENSEWIQHNVPTKKDLDEWDKKRTEETGQNVPYPEGTAKTSLEEKIRAEYPNGFEKVHFFAGIPIVDEKYAYINGQWVELTTKADLGFNQHSIDGNEVLEYYGGVYYTGRKVKPGEYNGYDVDEGRVTSENIKVLSSVGEDVSSAAEAYGDGVELTDVVTSDNTEATANNTQAVKTLTMSVEDLKLKYDRSGSTYIPSQKEIEAYEGSRTRGGNVWASMANGDSKDVWSTIASIFGEGAKSYMDSDGDIFSFLTSWATSDKTGDALTPATSKVEEGANKFLDWVNEVTGVDVKTSAMSKLQEYGLFKKKDENAENAENAEEEKSFLETIKDTAVSIYSGVKDGKSLGDAVKDALADNGLTLPQLEDSDLGKTLLESFGIKLYDENGEIDFTKLMGDYKLPDIEKVKKELEEVAKVDTSDLDVEEQFGDVPKQIEDAYKKYDFSYDDILKKYDVDPETFQNYGTDLGESLGLGQVEGYENAIKDNFSDISKQYSDLTSDAGYSSSSTSNLAWRGYDEKEGRDLYAPAMEEFQKTLVTPIREGWIWNGWNRKSKSDPLWLPDEKTQAKMDALKKTAEAVKESTDSTAASFEERSKSLKAEGKLLDGIDKDSKWLFDDNTMEWTLVDKNGNPITKEDMEGNVSNVTKAGTKIGSKYGVNDSILKNGVWVYDEKNDEWTLFDSKTNKEMLTKTGDEGFIVTRKNPELKKSEYAVLKNREDLDMTNGVRKFDYKDSAGLPQKIQDNKGHIYDAYGRKVKGYDNRYALTDKNGNLITGKNGNRIEFEVADDGTLRVLGEYNESAQIMKETAQTCVGLMSMGLGAIAKAFADNPEAAAELLKNGTTSDAVNTAAYATGNAETTETTTQYSSVQNGDATTTTTTNTKTSTASTSTTSQQTTQDAATVADRALSNLRSMNQTLVQIKGKIDMMQENVRSTNDNTRFINNQLIQISNSESPVILDTQALVGRLLPLINQGLGQYTSLGSRRVTT